MRKTITIRADDGLRNALEKRARIQGKNVSEIIREILQSAMEERPLGSKVGHLKGRLQLPRRYVESGQSRLHK